MILSITIPGEALSLNNAYATVNVKGRSRRVLTAAGRAYKRAVALHVRAARVKLPPGRLALTVTLYGRWDRQDGLPRRRDLTNTLKLLEDAVFEALGADDCRVRRVTAEARHSSRTSFIDLTLEPLHPRSGPERGRGDGDLGRAGKRGERNE